MSKLFLILINLTYNYSIYGISKESINKRDELGRTYLIYAAENNQIETVEILLKNGADINAQCKNGWTALMWASRNNNLEMINLLLDYDSDIALKNNGGHIAKFYTQDEQIEQILKIAQERLLFIRKIKKKAKNLLKAVQSREIGRFTPI